VNQQIRELLKQASKLANTDDNKDIDRTFDMIVAEKFAELIVRECLNQVFYTIEDEEEDNISGSIRDRIKQHFGVEE
jgi:hypothetical protein